MAGSAFELLSFPDVTLPVMAQVCDSPEVNAVLDDHHAVVSIEVQGELLSHTLIHKSIVEILHSHTYQ